MSEKNFVQIDPLALDEEWIRQPGLRNAYGVDLAGCRKAWEEAKNYYKVVEAETAMLVRKSPGTYGLEKVTEKAVEQTVPIQPAVKDAAQEIVDARHDMDVMEAAVAALDHKKKALEKLVELHLADYYGEPRAPAGAKDRLGEVGKKRARGKGVRRKAEQ